MGKINLGRVILGGVIAGIVSDILGYFVDGLWLANRWAAGMKVLGHTPFSLTQIIWFNILGIVGGIVTIWIYAAIRPRYGAGVCTAIRAAIAVWILGWLLPNLAFMYIPHLFSRHLMVFTTIGDLVEVVVGTIAGAALYKEA